MVKRLKELWNYDGTNSNSGDVERLHSSHQVMNGPSHKSSYRYLSTQEPFAVGNAYKDLEDRVSVYSDLSQILKLTGCKNSSIFYQNHHYLVVTKGAC